MDDEKYICHQCIDEPYIKEFISKKCDAKNKCSYCKKKLKSTSIENIADMFDVMINNYYDDAGWDYNGEPNGTEIKDLIQIHASVDHEIADDIFESLCEQFNSYEYDADQKYLPDCSYLPVNRRRGSFDRKWEEITNSLLTEARFFNSEAKVFLDELFADIHNQPTDNSDSVIKRYDTETILYRARVFNTIQEVEEALSQPERKLGPPPSKDAKSGRMNAQGVPVFYGSTSPLIAMAEVRPAVKSHVIMAQFKPLRELRILDLSALKSLVHIEGSKFDPENILKLEKTLFLKTLAYKLTIPVLDEVKGQEYLITQAVAEYLGLSQDFKLDGISFESTQVDASQVEIYDRNIVLFSKSALVKFARKGDTKRKYKISLFDYEENINGELDYYPDPTISFITNMSDQDYNYHWRSKKEQEDVIMLDVNNLKVHEITGVSYRVDTLELRRVKDTVESSSQKNSMFNPK